MCCWLQVPVLLLLLTVPVVSYLVCWLSTLRNHRIQPAGITSKRFLSSRSVFGFFSVPAKLYPWVLLVLLQLLMPGISFLGHLGGILSGYLCIQPNHRK
jgi:hypothetical protein